MLTYIKSFNIHPAVGGGPNTPDPVDWANLSWDTSDALGNISSQQITGISSSINLFITEDLTSPDILLYYRVDSSQVTGNITSQPTSPWIQVEGGFTGTTFTVNNNQWVSFSCWANDQNISATTMTVVNKSDNDAPLDTFTIQASK